MESRELLLYLSRKYNGNWESIYDAIQRHEEYDEEEVIAAKKNVGSKYITLLDDEYPEFLKTINRPPFVLYYHGDISLLDNRFNSIAVVGARECTTYGLACTDKLVKGLPKQMVIISGLARGIDAAAHTAAIQNKAKTIAVLGSGINYLYPEENRELYEIIKKDHLVISEYPDKTPPSISSFPIRNRIIAGLTNACLVPEALRNSGTSITAGMILENAGYVCCVPYAIGRNSLCNYLIHYGACLVENSEQILEEMNYKINNPTF